MKYDVKQNVNTFRPLGYLIVVYTLSVPYWMVINIDKRLEKEHQRLYNVVETTEVRTMNYGF